jgi:hypothetical protein
VQHKVSDDPSPALSGNSSACSSGEQCLERRNSLHTEILPPSIYWSHLRVMRSDKKGWRM